jgi:hypothetical protein
MDQGATRWLYSYAHKNYWRVLKVAPWMSPDDLINDGMMHWCRIVHRYELRPRRVRRNKHLMRLFQVTFINHVNDLSKRSRDDVSLEELSPAQMNSLAYRAPQEFMGLAPPLVKLAVAVLMTTAGAKKLRYIDCTAARRLSMNERLCYAVGLDPRIVDLPGEIMRFVRGDVPSTYSVNGI